MASSVSELTIDVPGSGPVSALLKRPPRARALLVLGHGAGAGMRHPFMEAVADALARRDLATLRFQFPYMEAGRKRPDRAPVAQAAVRAAAARGVREGAGTASVPPVFAGGKSFGGRMTSQAMAESLMPGVRGLVFLGFPLHAAGRPGTDRAAHLREVDVPMLFIQGTRDALADLELLAPLLEDLDHAALHVVEGGDHSFRTLKRSGRTEDEVMAEIADAIAAFVSAED